MSYIIGKQGTLIAKAPREMTSGEIVKYSSVKVKEEIDAGRDYNLANAHVGKISNAKKWDAEYARAEIGVATEINSGEFLI